MKSRRKLPIRSLASNLNIIPNKSVHLYPRFNQIVEYSNDRTHASAHSTTKHIQYATTSKPISRVNATQRRNLSRCEEIRRRVSWGLVDYAEWDGDPELMELVKPIFKKKRLVVWGLDPHPGPLDDIRSIIEPLGVEFIENIIQERDRCPRMCVCDLRGNLPKLTREEIYKPRKQAFDRIYNYTTTNASHEIERVDSFLVAQTTPFIELFMRYNRSIITVATVRYPYAINFDIKLWYSLNDKLRTLMSSHLNIVGANSIYDVEFMHYYLGARPDYIPGCAVYTGEHYQPTRKSFLYARRPYNRIGQFWNQQVNNHYKFINATFKIENLEIVYKSKYEFSDIAKHLGIVHQPYQVCI